METLRFLTNRSATAIAAQYGTPTFTYSEAVLRQQAQQFLDINAPFGQTIRYAMKANPNRHILSVFRDMGLKIDASSGFEAWRAIRAGFEPADISIASQEWPHDFAELAGRGVQFNACSMRQLEAWGSAFPGSDIGVRINPGIGSGHSHATNVGGPTSSFGVWHEQIPQIHDVARKYNLRIVRIHTHIGAGVDPAAWEEAMRISLGFVEQFTDVTTLDLGGGFKVGRMSTEHSTDIMQVGEMLRTALNSFAEQTGRKLHLELEPGTSLTANAGSLITTIGDMVSTGANGYDFIKVDAGMNDILRPILYGAQQPIVVINAKPVQAHDYVVVGHCCESGDLLTPAPGKPGELQPRALQRADVGDLLVIEGVGAYASTLSAHGYNSFPAAAEVLVRTDGSIQQIKPRETLEQLVALEY